MESLSEQRTGFIRWAIKRLTGEIPEEADTGGCDRLALPRFQEIEQWPCWEVLHLVDDDTVEALIRS